MAQHVWHRDDITSIGQTLIDIAPSAEFAAGVAALCSALGAPVRLPQRPPVVVINAGALPAGEVLQ